jgi:hypothetical protein
MHKQVPTIPGTVFHSIGVDRRIRPDELLSALPPMPRGAVAVIEGWVPIWHYGMALQRPRVTGRRGGLAQPGVSRGTGYRHFSARFLGDD